MQTSETKIIDGVTSYNGRWGWYPCSYQTFLKLKALNKVWQKALHQNGKWIRWDRKHPQNQVIRQRIRNHKNQQIGWIEIGPAPEPEINKVLMEIGRKYSWQEEKPLPKTVDLLKEYRKARYPKKDPFQVEPLSISEEEIDRLLSDLKIRM